MRACLQYGRVSTPGSSALCYQQIGFTSDVLDWPTDIVLATINLNQPKQRMVFAVTVDSLSFWADVLLWKQSGLVFTCVHLCKEKRIKKMKRWYQCLDRVMTEWQWIKLSMLAAKTVTTAINSRLVRQSADEPRYQPANHWSEQFGQSAKKASTFCNICLHYKVYWADYWHWPAGV